MVNIKYKHKLQMLIAMALLTISGVASAEDCSGNGATFHVKEGASGCILIDKGNKVVNCIVSGMMQHTNVLITSTGFSSNSNYSIPQSVTLLDHNNQRITFSGVAGLNARIDFQYYGPWDPSYYFDLTCSW